MNQLHYDIPCTSTSFSVAISRSAIQIKIVRSSICWNSWTTKHHNIIFLLPTFLDDKETKCCQQQGQSSIHDSHCPLSIYSWTFSDVTNITKLLRINIFPFEILFWSLYYPPPVYNYFISCLQADNALKYPFSDCITLTFRLSEFSIWVND